MQNGPKHFKDVIKVRFSVRKYSILRLKNYAKICVCYDQTKQKILEGKMIVDRVKLYSEEKVVAKRFIINYYDLIIFCS